MSSGRDEAHGGHDATFVTQLQPNDVLMGRGAPITDNVGNRRFLDLVREKCTGYQQAATRKEKDAIARQIVSIIHAQGGLFLRKIDSPEEAMQLGVPHQVAAWTAADEKTVLLKIKQALRDRSLEVREQGPSSTPQDYAEATEAPSQRNTEVLGADEMVAAGLSSLQAAPQLEQEPHAKRAKTEGLQEPSSRGVSSQASAPRLTMSAPAEVPNVGINRFQGASDSMLNLQLPLRTNFSHQARYRPGTAAAANYSQLPIAPAQLPMELDWSVPGPAGLDLSRAISIDLPSATSANVGGSEQGRLLGNLKRQANSAKSLAQAANLHQGSEGEKRNMSKEAFEKETSGEIALRIACELCEKGQGTSSSGGAGGGVNLDPIELCLLTVLSSRGLPTWSSTQFQDNGDIIISAVVASSTDAAAAAATSGDTTPFPLTWTDVGRHLVQEVESFLARKTSKLFPNDPPTLRALAIAGFVSRLVSMAVSYSKNPTTLARMTVMLLEKLRRQSQLAPMVPFAATASGVGASNVSDLPSFGRSISESSRGGSGFARENAAVQLRRAASASASVSTTRQGGGEFLFQGCLTSELRCWATSLKIVDEVGFPVPFSSSEFAVSHGQVNDVFSTAAILDAVGCQAILHQASFLTRLRSLLQSNPSDQVLNTLRAVSSQTPATRWGVTFVESALLDMSLIKALLTNGFSGLTNIVASSNTDDLLRTLLQHTSINKGDVEKQVVQLTCLLHRHFQSKKINQVMSQQAVKMVEMMAR